MSATLPRVVVLGAGAVARSLAAALHQAGVPVVCLWARRAEAAQAAAQAGVPARWGPALPDELDSADVVIVAVKDEAIGVLAVGLASSRLPASAAVLHTAGAQAAGVALAPLAGRAGGVGTWHPLCAITSAELARLAGVTFAIEGEPAACAYARQLTAVLGGVPLELTARDLPLYHAAAVLAANAVVALIDAAAQLLGILGRSPGEAQAALAPLTASALARLDGRPAAEALTGPIARGDAATVASHLAVLGQRAPQLLPIYRATALALVDLARRRQPPVPGEALERIAAMLR